MRHAKKASPRTTDDHMDKFGMPKAVRSDNDAVFKTMLFKTTLKLLGIRQQFTDLGSPWQNGRIERFWRTLKQALLQKHTSLKDGLLPIKTKIKFANTDAMQAALTDFQNH